MPPAAPSSALKPRRPIRQGRFYGVTEFVFRWKTHRVNDFERTIAAIAQVNGKKLTYKELILS
jgi:hypothetical protein